MPTSTSMDWPIPKRVGVLFPDRVAAGQQLGHRLEYLRGKPVVVLGLPRGGVPVAEQVARALDAPLDVILVRKLGVPFQHELAMGAIGEDGIRVLNDVVVRLAEISDRGIAVVQAREQVELARRAAHYRRERARIPLEGRIAVVVDDGIATGSTVRAACQVAKAAGATRVVVAVPVAPPNWTAGLGTDADEFVCLHTPPDFYAVGQFYANFDAVTDDEVVASLRRSGTRDGDVMVEAGPVRLAAHLTVPERPSGIVVFAHGSGSSHHSPRNRFVATVLNNAGLATLLFDLLTPEEEVDRSNVFDIDLLAGRLTDATHWLTSQPAVADLPVCYFGASTGAAAALRAAADPDAATAAVVSRGGRPDLAGGQLGGVSVPTLLIVGGSDDVVLDLNRAALDTLTCESRLTVIPGATHLFEEPGALAAVAEAARDWFLDHLGQQASGRRRD